MAFVALLLLEFLLGVFFLIKDRNETVEDVHDEPYLYYLYNPSETANKHGFKTSYTIEKPLNTYRIVLIGGSVARGKEAEQSISFYLERELSQRYNTAQIQVLNAGISGYVLRQEFILVQTILQQYEPDLIIGLDGYNDILTYYLNQSMNTHVAQPPMQYRDFRAIKEGRFRKKPYSRFAYFFKNVNRVKEYVVRKRDLNNTVWQEQHESNPCGTLCNTYWQTTDDLEMFCRAKGIFYVQFLQPINFEARMPMDDQAKTISQNIYAQMDEQAKPRPYVFTLAHALDEDSDLFYDDVHLTPEGNQRVAWAMADSLAPVFYQLFN